MTKFQLKRIYEAPAKTDGYRVLVDRVWPRGVSKEEADLDQWCKEVAPSTELRKWFNHIPDRYAEFAERYRAELADSTAYTELVQLLADKPVVTILVGAKDAQHSQGQVLLEVLGGR